MPRALKRGILGTSTMILSKDIDKYSFMCGLNFYETDVRNRKKKYMDSNIWKLFKKFYDWSAGDFFYRIML